MERETGLEPATPSLEGWCSTTELFPPTVECMVGAIGFEPTTPWSQTMCATKLRHAPPSRFIL
jgi:hypothetical protein